MRANHILALLFTCSTSSVLASEAYISLGASQSVYETDATSGGRMTSLLFGVESENAAGQFHRLNLQGALAAESSPGSGDDEYLSIEYGIGKYWYPRASAQDYSIWAGLGQWSMKDAIGTSGGVERKSRALYFPVGFEAAIPVTSSSTYFVYGGSVHLVIDGTIETPSATISNKGGYGYSGWLGFDFRWSDTTMIETRLNLTKRTIDEGDFELTDNNLSLSVRF